MSKLLSKRSYNKHMVVNKHGLKRGYNWKVAAVKVQDYGYQNEEEKET